MSSNKILKKTLFKFFAVIIVLSIGVILLPSLLLLNEPTVARDTETDTRLKIPVVKAEIIHRGPELTLYGKVKPKKKTTISTKVSSTVLAVHVREGEYINEGELLITLDKTDAVIDVMEKRARLKSAITSLTIEESKHDSELKRLDLLKKSLQIHQENSASLSELHANKMASKSTLNESLLAQYSLEDQVKQLEENLNSYDARSKQLRTQIDLAYAGLEHAELELSRAEVFSPYGGFITDIMVSPGDLISPQVALVSMYDPHSIELEASISINKAQLLQKQLEESKSSLAYADSTQGKIPLKLLRIADSSITGNTFGKLAYFSNLDKNIRPNIGEVTDITVELDPEEVILLPDNAIYENSTIYRVYAGKLSAVEIEVIGKTVEQGRPSVLIRPGDIQNGTLIVAKRVIQAREGLNVVPYIVDLSSASQ